MRKTWLLTLLVIDLLFLQSDSKVLAASTSSSASQSLPANSVACTPGGEDDQCGENKYCEMKGSKALCVCPDTGYVSKGDICEEIDECKQKNIRHKCKQKGATCENIPGSYKCQCKTGFEMGEKHCEDVDECHIWEVCHENAICKNTRGSYRCSCAEGFAGDGFECVVDKVYKQKEKIKLIIMIGGAAGGGALLIIALVAFCCCARKRKSKEKEDEEKIEKVQSTLSEYGGDWESSDSSEDDDDVD